MLLRSHEQRPGKCEVKEQIRPRCCTTQSRWSWDSPSDFTWYLLGARWNSEYSMMSHLPWVDPSSLSVSAPVLPWEAQLSVSLKNPLHPGQHLLLSKPSSCWQSSLEWHWARFWKVYHLIFTHAHTQILLLNSWACSFTLYFCCKLDVTQLSSLRLQGAGHKIVARFLGQFLVMYNWN